MRLTIKCDYDELAKSITAHTQIIAEFEVEKEELTKEFIKEKADMINDEAKKLFEEALLYSSVKTQQKTLR